MKLRATTFGLLLLLLSALPAQSQEVQEVTVREINAIPEAQVQQLITQGSTLTGDDFFDLLYGELTGQVVAFTAVVLSNPRNSGLSSASDGLPSRVHLFVRDTSAVTQGVEGMGIQVVDGAWADNGTLNLAVGDVIRVTGTVAPFNSTMQVSPETIEFVGPYDALGLPETLLDPVVLSTSEINQAIEGGINPDWESLASIRGQYVRIEDASIISRTIAARPTWYVSSDGNETVVNIYDTSLRYRNDRGSYSETEFNVRTSEDGDFVPPPPGASVNLQGFLTFPGSGATDSDGRGIPAGRLLSINPMDDDDLEITETPPIITALSKPEGVPGTDPVDVTVEVDADPTRSVAEVTLVYSTTTNPEEQALAMSLVEGAVYEATIPAAADGDFVTYYVEAEDNTGARSASSPNVYRVLSDGITEIAHIQETPSGGPGDSPFLGTAVPMDITVTVQAAPGFGGSAVGGFPVQDDPLLGPWSGVMIRDAEVTAAWNVGDVVRITEAEILENFGVTSLRDLVAEKVGEGDPLPHKTVTTDLLRDNSIAEAHEGMMLRFEDVTVTNPDAGFGEWQFSSDGTAGNAVRADDASDAFSSDFASTSFEEGTELEYLQGLWWFSFSNYKLVPVELDDVGFLTSVEPGEIASRFALSQNYPNPFNPATLIEYSVPAAGKVTLEVFDMLGRKVATLVDGQMPAGVHGITFEAAGLSSGLYLYRLSAGNHVATRTMMLIK